MELEVEDIIDELDQLVPTVGYSYSRPLGRRDHKHVFCIDWFVLGGWLVSSTGHVVADTREEAIRMAYKRYKELLKDEHD